MTVDFSGWALVTHRWMPDSVAYAAVEAIDERRDVIPVDDDKPLRMRNLCRSTEKCRSRFHSIPEPFSDYKAKRYV
jgi:hypothetical protein